MHMRHAPTLACAPVCLYSHRCTSPMIVPIIVPAGCRAVIEVTVQQVCFSTDESNSLPRSFTTAVKNVGSVALMLPHFGETHSRPASERVPRPHCCAWFMIWHFWPGVSVGVTQVRSSDAVRKKSQDGGHAGLGRTWWPTGPQRSMCCSDCTPNAVSSSVRSSTTKMQRPPTRNSGRRGPHPERRRALETKAPLSEKNLLCLDM